MFCILFYNCRNCASCFLTYINNYTITSSIVSGKVSELICHNYIHIYRYNYIQVFIKKITVIYTNIYTNKKITVIYTNICFVNACLHFSKNSFLRM